MSESSFERLLTEILLEGAPSQVPDALRLRVLSAPSLATPVALRPRSLRTIAIRLAGAAAVAVVLAVAASGLWLHFAPAAARNGPTSAIASPSPTPEASAAASSRPSPTGKTLPLKIHNGTVPPGHVCHAVGGEPARIERSGSELIFVSVKSGQPMAVYWPAGYSARLVDGVGELVADDGTVVGREGDVIDGLLVTDSGTGIFIVCGPPDGLPAS
jgi:hypothetical protein